MAHLYKFYNILLKNLKVPEYENVYQPLISSNYDFYRQYAYVHFDKQYGGGKSEKIKYTYDNYIFIIYVDTEIDRITYAIHNEADETKEACVILFIPKKENYIYILKLLVIIQIVQQLVCQKLKEVLYY